jgi:hypothetical protein
MNIHLSFEALARVTYSVIPAKAGIQNRFKTWIPSHASLARNDDFSLLPRVLKELLSLGHFKLADTSDVIPLRTHFVKKRLTSSCGYAKYGSNGEKGCRSLLSLLPEPKNAGRIIP